MCGGYRITPLQKLHEWSPHLYKGVIFSFHYIPNRTLTNTLGASVWDSSPHVETRQPSACRPHRCWMSSRKPEKHLLTHSQSPTHTHTHTHSVFQWTRAPENNNSTVSGVVSPRCCTKGTTTLRIDSRWGDVKRCPRLVWQALFLYGHVRSLLSIHRTVILKMDFFYSSWYTDNGPYIRSLGFMALKKKN